MKTFLEKIETQFDELIAVSELDLCRLYGADNDAYLSLFHSVQHQLVELMKKTYENEHGYKDYNLYNKLCEKHTVFLERIETNGVEQQYHDLLAEFETVKNTLKCTQCGSLLNIDKIYFIPTYIDCPTCYTQNTLNPSQAARNFVINVHQLSRNSNCDAALTKYKALLGDEMFVEETESSESDSMLTPVHGISFYDYVAVIKMITAHRMPLEEALRVLGVEEPVWAEAATIWGQRITQDTYKLYTEYMEKADAHPKFANTIAGSPHSRNVAKFLDDPYLLFEVHSAYVAVLSYGLDYNKFLSETFGVTLFDITMAYAQFVSANKDNMDLMTKLSNHSAKTDEKYQAKFAAALGGDIADSISA